MKAIGWIRASSQDQYEMLQRLGIEGEIHYGRGTLEHCEADEETMARLIAEYPGFWPGAFTVVDEEENALPNSQQKYWKMGNDEKYWVNKQGAN